MGAQEPGSDVLAVGVQGKTPRGSAGLGACWGRRRLGVSKGEDTGSSPGIRAQRPASAGVAKLVSANR